jgi:hypothetical protein
MEGLRQIPYDENISLALFIVKNMYTIINTSELQKNFKNCYAHKGCPILSHMN